MFSIAGIVCFNSLWALLSALLLCRMASFPSQASVHQFSSAVEDWGSIRINKLMVTIARGSANRKGTMNFGRGSKALAILFQRTHTSTYKWWICEACKVSRLRPDCGQGTRIELSQSTGIPPFRSDWSNRKWAIWTISPSIGRLWSRDPETKHYSITTYRAAIHSSSVTYLQIWSTLPSITNNHQVFSQVPTSVARSQKFVLYDKGL